MSLSNVIIPASYSSILQTITLVKINGNGNGNGNKANGNMKLFSSLTFYS
jgi:hypothetical protein